MLIMAVAKTVKVAVEHTTGGRTASRRCVESARVPYHLDSNHIILSSTRRHI